MQSGALFKRRQDTNAVKIRVQRVIQISKRTDKISTQSILQIFQMLVRSLIKDWLKDLTCWQERGSKGLEKDKDAVKISVQTTGQGLSYVVNIISHRIVQACGILF